MNNQQQTLETLFSEAGDAHHDAFAHVDGADDEWALWYADYIHERLSEILGTEFTRQQIADALTQLDIDYRAQPHSETWQRYYANYFLKS